ncbi:DUF2970 domain-containing protein [Halomonas sp. 18H]|uniref:DUF2970 domain-containing protein n=1 Tax=Halomonas almeriensis TaxID=308163 RepID=UPI00223115F1|nr:MULTISPECIES: DUF2970 domain-containing protein [Halomonas]MCW4151788.1 DUF2970 domain-containing protein [Halomonas sp. 18H]MDN3554034.1 DUF2970 domain-containing protein [Halomonas almeriensis]
MWRVIQSVLAAFFGVQKESRRTEDFTHGRGFVFIVVGLVMAALLVGLLVLVASLAAE